MRFHALACDYDGTIASGGKVGDETIAALEAIRASGRHLILVTGRELDDLRQAFAGIDVFDRVVAENGGLLYRPETKETRLLTEPPDPRLLARLKDRGVQPLGVGRTIIATSEPNDAVILEVARELGLELAISFNKGAVMVLPAGVNKASGLMAALAELRLSAHSVIGVGDAENDHAFLSVCELAAATANAVDSLKAQADLVLDFRDGEGVHELAARLLSGDLDRVERGLERIRVPLGEADGHLVSPPGHGARVLVTGSSGSGKSTLVTAFLEGLRERGYQFCLVDPEGDYGKLTEAVVLGTPHRPPTLDEARTALGDPTTNVVVNLLGLGLEERPAFFAKLLVAVQELRTSAGRPHWLIVDEAHHMLPVSWRPPAATVPSEINGVLLVTVHPDSLARSVVEQLDTAVVIGPDAADVLMRVASVAGEAVAAPIPAPEQGEGLLWRRGGPEVGPTVERFRLAKPRQATVRHRRKYATGELPDEKSFYFRGPDDRLALRAQNLQLFLQIGDGVDDATWLHHLRRGDYSRWVRDSIKDDELANAIAEVEQDQGSDAAASRRRIREAVEGAYTAPA